MTAIILSGGKSTRMGENKSLLLLDGKKLIEHVFHNMQSIFSNVILITNQREEYRFLGIEMFEDVFKYQGPLAGIHSGLYHTTTEKNFIISCDLPLMTKEMIEFIVAYATDKLITVTRADGFIQQLCGIYSKECVSAAEKLLASEVTISGNHHNHKSKCQVLQLIDHVGAEIIDANSIPYYEEGMFLNMNRKEDYEEVVKRMNLKFTARASSV
ncbi:MAG: molybdenum cofactor guanylyltransferase [Bacteroidetes bacterium]|nr:molybdenum cofactor guanylyltransferase [Bacteroidota bacterium]